MYFTTNQPSLSSSAWPLPATAAHDEPFLFPADNPPDFNAALDYPRTFPTTTYPHTHTLTHTGAGPLSSNTSCVNCGEDGHDPLYCQQPSPSVSPTGTSFVPSSAPYYSHSAPAAQHLTIRYPYEDLLAHPSSHSYPPTRSTPSSRYTHTHTPSSLTHTPSHSSPSSHTTPPSTHEIFERRTGEDDAFHAHIRRLPDDERRALPGRPAFVCGLRACGGAPLMHRAQVRAHLVECHGMRFCKPFGCSCGAEFGRQVEAARHVEDKKACEICLRAGRKSKGSSICTRCLRMPGH